MAVKGKNISNASHVNQGIPLLKTSGKKTGHRIAFWFMCGTITLQVIYHGFMTYKFRSEVHHTECSGLPGVSAESSNCFEARMFASWQKSDIRSLSDIFDAGEPNILLGVAPLAAAPLQAIFTTVAPQEAAAITTIHAILYHDAARAAGATHLRPTQDIWAEFDKLYNETSAIIHNRTGVSPFAQGLMDLQKSMQAQYEHLPSTIKRRAQERHAELDRLYNASIASRNNSGITQWGRGLVDLQASLQAEYDNLPSTRQKRAEERQAKFDKLYQMVKDSIKSRSSVTPWARGLQGLQASMQARLDSARGKASAKADQAKQGATLQDQVDAFGLELCEDPLNPHRRSLPACKQFLAKAAEVKRQETTKEGERLVAKIDETMAQSNLHAQQLENKAMALGQELCADPKRAHYAACASFRVSAVAGSAKTVASEVEHPSLFASLSTGFAPDHRTPPSVALRGSVDARVDKYLNNLAWRKVTAWKSALRKRGDGPEVVTRDALRGAHWQGMIPKVGCITAIEPGQSHVVRARMSYFINNFNMQNYEGPRQLVLVYHTADKEAARVVQKYADGITIKGVATHGDGAFDFTTALRYGAWSSDADAIVRWDFAEWHHPQRLSLQVKALAKSTRPACLIALPHGPAADDAQRFAEESGTIAGEASWMREHWHPMLGHEDKVLEGAQAHNVVRVDAPEISTLGAVLRGVGGSDAKVLY